MSLLQNEEFVIYQLRTAYLANIHDGVGERLISVNTGFLNDPAFRAAGWSANPAELKRCYSPPIPTAVTSEYFQAPPHSAGLKGAGGAEDDFDEDGLTGVASQDTVGPIVNVKRRRRRERELEEDDSSDLSDESDENAEAQQRPAGQIRFAKMPVRHRAGSSPIRRTSHSEGPSSVVSPSKLSEQSRQRTGSLGAIESGKVRIRRDTITSSEVSSDGNELDPSTFKRRQLKGRNPVTNVDRIKEEDHEHEDEDGGAATDSDDSLVSGFSETLESNSFLAQSFPLRDIAEQQTSTPPQTSPKKNKSIAEALQIMPTARARPISTMHGVSALSTALKAKNKTPSNPLERFAILSGTGDASPLYIKLFVPSATNLSKPLEIVIKKTTEGDPVTVSEAIGFCLWKYGEANLHPPVTGNKRNVNRWTLRIVDDGDVDYDFPPLSRTKPITDFTSNNNRPARARARDKPWDEVALVEADPAQFRENETLTPLYSEQAAAVTEESQTSTDMPPPPPPTLQRATTQPPPQIHPSIRPNPITNPTFIGHPIRQNSAVAADAPSPASHAQERSGAAKAIKIHFTANDVSQPLHFRIDTTTDTYIAEIFDTACKRLNIDKALYMLKVTGTGVVAPADRTVEALGADRDELDLVRKRFVGEGTFGLSGSPGSTSPNAPLLLNTSNVLTTPRKLKKSATTPTNPTTSQHPLAQQYDPIAAASLVGLPSSGYKRYLVVRKQPMSFTPSHARVLVLDGDYMHLMPSDNATTTGERGTREKLFDTSSSAGKSTSVHFSSVVGCKVNRKHPKTFRVVVFREKESKRYDFEAGSKEEARDIVEGIKRGMAPFRDVT